MLFKSNYIKKRVSAILLVTLLFIHSIKLLHTHSNNDSFSTHNCRGNCFEKNDNSDLTNPSSDCSICNYQLTRDTDDLVYPAFISFVSEPPIFHARIFSFQRFSHPSSLEDRGPPANSL